MRKILYVIDPTSRQHGFEIPPAGLRVTFQGGLEFTISYEDPSVDAFYPAFLAHEPFVIHNEISATMFNPVNVTAVQVVNQDY